MAHPHVELAQHLQIWDRTGEDRNGAFADGKRKGYIVRSGPEWVLSAKGREFVNKWTSRQGTAA